MSGIGTADNGMDPAGDVFVFTVPGGVTQIDRGTAMVTYGPVITLQPGDPFPQSGIYDIQSGQMQADNQVFARTVTITPAT